MPDRYREESFSDNQEPPVKAEVEDDGESSTPCTFTFRRFYIEFAARSRLQAGGSAARRRTSTLEDDYLAGPAKNVQRMRADPKVLTMFSPFM